MAIHIKPSHKGLLHKKLGVPQGQPIPASKLAKAAHSKSGALRKEVNFAENAKHFKHGGKKMAKDGYDNGGARGVAAGAPRGSGKAAPDGKNESKNGLTSRVDGMAKSTGHPYPKHGKVHGVGVMPHDGMAKEFTPRTGKGSPHPGEEHLPHVHTSKHH